MQQEPARLLVPDAVGIAQQGVFPLVEISFSPISTHFPKGIQK